MKPKNVAPIPVPKPEKYGRSPALNYLRSVYPVDAVGLKHDSLKPRWSLVPLNVMTEVIAVLECGAKKYSPDNWKYVPDAEQRYYDAAMRHITARQAGEINDPETKRNHLAHALCCLIFWLWFDLKKRRGHR